MVKTVVSFLLIFQFALLAFAAPVAGEPAPTQVQTYTQLVQAIRQAQAASQKRTDEAVAQEKVRGAWEIGQLIQVTTAELKSPLLTE